MPHHISLLTSQITPYPVETKGEWTLFLGVKHCDVFSIADFVLRRTRRVLEAGQ